MRSRQRSAGRQIAGAALRQFSGQIAPGQPSRARLALANGPSGAAARRSDKAETAAVRASAIAPPCSAIALPVPRANLDPAAPPREACCGPASPLRSEWNASHGREQRQHQTVEKATPPACAFGEQAVHCRRQPQYRQALRQRRCRGRRAVDPHLPPLGCRRGRPGADVYVVETRRDREAARAFLPRHFGKARAAPVRVQRPPSSTASRTLVLPAPCRR